MIYVFIASLVIVLLVIGFFVGKTIFTANTHNKLLKLKNKVENASAHINVQLQRRFDLVPSLVEVVKGATAHEQQIINNLYSLFERFSHMDSNAEKFLVNEELSRLLKTLYSEVEMLPNIRANQNFLHLQKELSEIEEDISFARQFYNDAVTIYNNAIMSYPNNIVAQKYNFQKEKLFEVAKDVEKTPHFRMSPRRPNEIKCVTCGAIIEEGMSCCKYCGTMF